jgi:hypothetical protein
MVLTTTLLMGLLISGKSSEPGVKAFKEALTGRTMHLSFGFSLWNHSLVLRMEATHSSLLLEKFRIYYLDANGTLSREYRFS